MMSRQILQLVPEYYNVRDTTKVNKTLEAMYRIVLPMFSSKGHILLRSTNFPQ